jgi:plastocyanin
VVLAERYVLDRLMGEGPAARVYLARDLLLQRDVAVKVLRAFPDPASSRRAVRAAQANARVEDRHLVHVLDVEAGARPFVVLAPAVGRPLRDVRRTLSPQACVALARDVLGGLAALHRAGLVHRDVTVDNVLALDDGRGLLTSAGLAEAAVDPGLGLLLHDAKPSRNRRAPSPEQELGLPADLRSDVHAAGVLLHELLGEPPDPVLAVIRTATAEDPRERYPDAIALEHALGAALRVVPVDRHRQRTRVQHDVSADDPPWEAADPAARHWASPPPGPDTTLRPRPPAAPPAADWGRPPGRRRRWLLVALVAVLLAAALAVVAQVRSAGAPAQPQLAAADPPAAPPPVGDLSTLPGLLAAGQADPAVLGAAGPQLLPRLRALGGLAGPARAVEVADLYGLARTGKATGALVPAAADTLTGALRGELTPAGVAALLERDPAAAGADAPALARALRDLPGADDGARARLAAQAAAGGQRGSLTAAAATAAMDAVGGEATPQAVEVSEVEVGVPGTQQFTDVGVEVAPGSVVAIVAGGTVFHNAAAQVGPDGDAGGEAFSLIPSAGHAALLARIGVGEPFAAGPEAVFPVAEGGRLVLGVNDTGVDNNAGAFAARVRVASR